MPDAPHRRDARRGPRSWVRFLLMLTGGSAAAVAAAYFYFLSFHPDPARYPVRGIDVSHHQGLIDWYDVAGSGIDFVYMKATEGGDFSDRRFQRNWHGAKAAGLRYGAYHFFTLCRPGAAQAAHFIRRVPLDPDALPPAVDLEFGGNCSAQSGHLDLESELTAFLDLVEPHYGRKALLYTTREFYRERMAGKAFDNPLWLRSIFFEPDYGARPWRFWQYHNRSRISGIEGPVDRNVFAGSMEEFEAHWSGRSAPKGSLPLSGTSPR